MAQSISPVPYQSIALFSFQIPRPIPEKQEVLVSILYILMHFVPPLLAPAILHASHKFYPVPPPGHECCIEKKLDTYATPHDDGVYRVRVLFVAVVRVERYVRMLSAHRIYAPALAVVEETTR